MATTNGTPRWTRSLKTWSCDACGTYICAGEIYAYYPSTLEHTCGIACRNCADGEQLEDAFKATAAAHYGKYCVARPVTPIVFEDGQAIGSSRLAELGGDQLVEDLAYLRTHPGEQSKRADAVRQFAAEHQLRSC